MKLALFAYDFPHYKTEQFVYRFLVAGHSISYVLAAPWRDLHYPKQILRDGLRLTDMMHPRHICKHFAIPYVVADHNGSKCYNYIRNHPVELAVISGARILKEATIRLFPKGIVNLHPGCLPNIRGLDTLKWSIYLDKPIGVTAHLISKKIDSGRFLYYNDLRLYYDDTLPEISFRLLQVQPAILIKVLKILKVENVSKLRVLDQVSKEYHSAMSPELEIQIPKLFPKWLKKYAKL